MTVHPSRAALVARLHRERYGDPDRLDLERYQPGPTPRPRSTTTVRDDEHVLAGRRFLLMRGLADAHPTGTWRRNRGAA